MTAEKDIAVCLGSRKYSETSQIVSFFGRRHGKIQAIAKGSRRQRGRFGGGIEVLATGEILFIPPRNENTLATLTDFDLQNSFLHLRENLLALHTAQYMAYLLNEFTEVYDPHETLFDAFINTLSELKPLGPMVHLLVRFENILLKEIGLCPLWRKCSSCAREMSPNEPLYFSSSLGGMLCRDCEPTVIEKRRLSPPAWHILRQPENKTHPNTAYMAAHTLLGYHFTELAGKRPAILNFLNHLLKETYQKETEIADS